MATTAARPDSLPTILIADGFVQLITRPGQTDRNVRELADEDVAAPAGAQVPDPEGTTGRSRGLWTGRDPSDLPS